MIIVITLPHFFDGEAEAITAKFQSGLQRLHLRKPDSTADACRQLLDDIPECYHDRIVLHDHFQLMDEYRLGGIHLNSRNTAPLRMPREGESVSCSCHSLGELQQRKVEGYTCADGNSGQFTYLSLSPIFDSISKEGYNSNFSEEDITKAQTEGIIDERVMALGGICHDNIHKVREWGFGGAMILGDAWRKPQLPIVLTIAGSDPSAGAGIQQDMRTINNCGCYPTTVITAITSQNTMGVQGVMPVPPSVVESQLRSIFTDIRVDAVKIGMIPDIDVARTIVTILREERSKGPLPIVCDPVMISTSGTRLMSEDCIDYICQELFPLCTLITPNLPEAKVLNLPSNQERYSTSCLIKGGHAEQGDMTDTLHLLHEHEAAEYTSPRIATTNLHGTGCTLSSAIASHLAHGNSLKPAIASAKEYMNRAIAGGRDLNIGHGNGPVYSKTVN